LQVAAVVVQVQTALSAARVAAVVVQVVIEQPQVLAFLLDQQLPSQSAEAQQPKRQQAATETTAVIQCLAALPQQEVAAVVVEVLVKTVVRAVDRAAITVQAEQAFQGKVLQAVQVAVRLVGVAVAVLVPQERLVLVQQAVLVRLRQ
jgi:hypothetical protein